MKQFETKEECLKENGGHAWHKIQDTSGMSCAVYHSDGYCSWDDPKEKCYHCLAERTFTRTQSPKFEWIEK